MSWHHMPEIALSDDQLPLVLVGLPGAGKTTVARLLAQALGVQVTDTDAEIRRRARMTIPEIFATEGEEGFRDREYRAMLAVLDSPAAAQGVIALGGGAVLRQSNRRLLSGRTVIHLSASPATAAAHVGDGAGRPVVKPGADSDQARAAQEGPGGATPDAILALMETLHEQRFPLYTEVASLTVPTDGLSPQQVAALILVALGADAPQTARALSAMGATKHQRSGEPASEPAPTTRAAPAPGARSRRAEAEGHGLITPELPGVDAHGRRRIQVGGPAPYEVVIGHDLTPQLIEAVAQAPGRGAGGVAIIHSASLDAAAGACQAALSESGLRVNSIEAPDGEQAKTTAVLDRIWGELGQMRMGRDGLIVGLGGGAITDLAGFAAATWLRGVPVVQAPTSLLAMVDAAVGGKTGINAEAGKNLVGAFHTPAAVIADLRALETLPVEELRAGLGEVIKCGFIADPVILDRILADPADCLVWDSPVLAELVARCVAVKAAVVSQDLAEAGLREILNYGHTYAHAVERLTDYTWRHGEAVAVGCVFAAEAANRAGRLDSDALALHRQALSAVGLPTTFPQGAGRWREMAQIMGSDKKVRAGGLRMVLLDAIAHPVRCAAPEEALLEHAHQAVTQEAAS
ncbi:3-dehydroquinate synthase [Actinomyces slackii]|uniref:Multifunctional fusion protein n=1 Tax=Actinomyces slackii TaxID=52774 RepID=A0A448KED5_9ACTO|nr:3-dehydroquinate synthase [Actinomyces slackii]VEG75314.1 3-dehydroquinate synthase [Actinomyces slackii]